jgi:hypothetical protein
MSKTFEQAIQTLRKEYAYEALYLDYLERNPIAIIPELPIQKVREKVNELSLAIKILEGNSGQN